VSGLDTPFYIRPTVFIRQLAHHFFYLESSMKYWLFLAIAIISEITATSSLKASAGFTRVIPSIVVVIGYALSFYFLSLTLKSIPIGIAYAIWAGLGIVLLAIVGWVFYDQQLDTAALIGMSFILAGVIIMNLFSKTVSHS
jgi:small multidrug resistance pump